MRVPGFKSPFVLIQRYDDSLRHRGGGRVARFRNPNDGRWGVCFVLLFFVGDWFVSVAGERPRILSGLFLLPFTTLLNLADEDDDEKKKRAFGGDSTYFEQ